MRRVIKYTLLGIVLVLLFHFESLSLGAAKISHLWKGALLVYLIIAVIQKNQISFFVYTPLIILSLLQLVNYETINNTFNAIVLFGTNLILPLLGMYVLQFSQSQLKDLLLFFSSFFILCFIPYELHWIESITEGYKLTDFGGSKEMVGLVGPFQTEHSASIALASGFLPVLYFWLEKSYNRIYLSALLILGFYFLIMTYVRTGMIMVALGSIPILFHFIKRNFRSRFRAIMFIVTSLILVAVMVLPNQILINRIMGERSQTSEMESFEELGSGRVRIWKNSFLVYTEGTFYEQLLGMGITKQKALIGKKIKEGVYPHNGFLLLLVNNGLIGLIVFLIFIKLLFGKIKTIPNNLQPFVQGLFLTYLILVMLVNYDELYVFLILVLGLTYGIKEKNKVQNLKYEMPD